MQPKLIGIDHYIKEEGIIQPYIEKKDEIVDEYLYNEKQLNLTSFNMSDYDIAIISYALNCIVTIKDDIEKQIVKKYILEMIDMYHATSHSYKHNDILNIYQISETQALLQRELLLGDTHTEIVLAILFDNIDFSKFNHLFKP